MADEWAQYKVEQPSDEWSQYKDTPKEVEQPSLREQYKNMPDWLFNLIKAGAEKAGDSPALQKAGDVAGYISQAVEPTVATAQGLARGVTSAGSAPINYLSQLIAGQDIAAPLPETQESQDYPILSKTGEIGGELGAMGASYGALGKIPALAGEGVLPASFKAGLTGFGMTPGSQAERITSGTIGAVAPGVAKGFQSIKEMVKSTNPKNLVDSLLKSHDAASKSAKGAFNNVAENIAKKDIGDIKVSNKLYDEIEKSVASPKFKPLVENARKGSYEDIHKLQSGLGKRSRKAMKSDSFADHNYGEKLDDLRNSLNKSLEWKLADKGHHNIAEDLQDARLQYAKYKDLYHGNPDKGRNITITKMLGGERKIPKNPMTAMLEDSTYMNELRAAHPELQRAKELENLIKGKKFVASQAKHAPLGALGLYEFSKLFK